MYEISVRVREYLDKLHIPTVTSITFTDVVEICIIAFLVYGILVWIKETRAWALLKGVLVIAVFLTVAAYFQMTTILWIAARLGSLAITAIIVVLQPELRKALENLGQRNFFSSILPFDALRSAGNERFSDKTVNEIVKACVEMGKVKTGALIVMERKQSLAEYERTGIDVDAIVTSQLLINIFEHNTPLHDGAVIIRGDRVVSATCYLPLSDNRELSKDLGTRHRAGVGISEETDSLTIIVSEETGKISVAQEGKLDRGLTAEMLRERMTSIQDKVVEDKKRIIWKGRSKNEE
ncbi:MAG: TIGR00159 family protein [Lachnospiraceae bacterium]|nr:TIGR00159 family protein [Lachnospiraceae bacterium]